MGLKHLVDCRFVVTPFLTEMASEDKEVLIADKLVF